MCNISKRELPNNEMVQFRASSGKPVPSGRTLQNAQHCDNNMCSRIPTIRIRYLVHRSKHRICIKL